MVHVRLENTYTSTGEASSDGAPALRTGTIDSAGDAEDVATPSVFIGLINMMVFLDPRPPGFSGIVGVEIDASNAPKWMATFEDDRCRDMRFVRELPESAATLRITPESEAALFAGKVPTTGIEILGDRSTLAHFFERYFGIVWDV